MTAHTRAAWAPVPPIEGTPFPGWAAITRAVLHYPGQDFADLDFDNDGDIDPADTASILRAMQASYERIRGYSLGYCWAFDQSGDEFEVRGDTFRNAANAGPDDGPNLNDDSVSYLCIVDAGDPASPAMIAAVRRRHALNEAKAGRPLPIVRHGDLDSTPCPGPGLTTQLVAGLFSSTSPGTQTPPPSSSPDPNNPPPKEPDDMPKLIRFEGYASVFLIGAGPALHLTEKLAASYVTAGLTIEVVDAHPLGMASVCHQAGIAKANIPKTGDGR